LSVVFPDTSPPELYTLSLHDALPIFISWIDSAKQPETRRRRIERACSMLAAGKRRPCCYSIVSFDLHKALAATPMAKAQWSDLRSEEHTSELQSRSDLVCRLLLEKKK